MDQLDGKFSRLPLTIELFKYKFVYNFNICKKYNAHNALLGSLTAIHATFNRKKAREQFKFRVRCY